MHIIRSLLAISSVAAPLLLHRSPRSPLELICIRGAAFSAPAPQALSESGNFHWEWKRWRELSSGQSLRNAKLSKRTKEAIASAIADEIRPMMADLEIESEGELVEKVLATRITLLKLSDGGATQVIAQGMIDCGATGNCPFWILQRKPKTYEVLLHGYAQTFTVQQSVTNHFHDIVLATHGSYSSGDLVHYKFQRGAYQSVASYSYEWVILENDKQVELKEPRVTRTN